MSGYLYIAALAILAWLLGWWLEGWQRRVDEAREEEVERG